MGLMFAIAGIKKKTYAGQVGFVYKISIFDT